MLLLDRSPVELWRLLLPEKFILYPNKDYPYEELIFFYRNYIYFVHEDGSVIRMNKPTQLKKLDVDDLWELLFHDRDTFDYDDHGIFTIGAILLDIGFLLPAYSSRGKADYQIEIVQAGEPQRVVGEFEIRGVTFQFALYQAFILCHVWNGQLQEELEYEIRQITQLK
ncbi:MAG TPA: hypothetical protein VJ824_05885 [Bacillota bacterium]|nr:hypothetical protein [Bacillota bacterium]